jgi:hypothetical protein
VTTGRAGGQWRFGVCATRQNSTTNSWHILSSMRMHMAKVTVHHFEIWDISRGDWVRQPLKSTAERIMEATRGKGRTVPGTAEEVDASELYIHGRYDPQRSPGVKPSFGASGGDNSVMVGYRSDLVNRLAVVRSLEGSC